MTNVLANFEDWQQQLQAARQAIQKQRWADAIEPARRAVALYPEHVGGDSPHLMLARALDKLNRRADAIVALEDYRRAGGWDPGALRELARWLDEAGRGPEATERDGVTQLLRSAERRRALTTRRALADRGSRTKTRCVSSRHCSRSIRWMKRQLTMEWRAPYVRWATNRGSRRHLLDALATAPHFKPAQALLLKMIEERT